VWRPCRSSPHAAAPPTAANAAAWLTTDPGTGLPTAPIRTEALPLSRQGCFEHWRREFVDPDVNLFRQLARAEVPAASLRASAGDPQRSGRYRRFLRPLGMDDELRAVLRAGDAVWGSVTLWRQDGAEPFSAKDVQVMASISTPLAEALRTRSRPTGPAVMAAAREEPGLLLFDAHGTVISANEDARRWIAELPADRGFSTDLGVDVPVWMIVTVFRAAAGRHGYGDGTARARVRTRTGVWLTCHASCLAGRDDAPAVTALVIEPACPADVAPIIVDAYDLTPREREITSLIARGAGTNEIAATVHLSSHTVRDHIKAIFAKTEVTSRGELVAKLYAEFYGPASHPGGVPTPSSRPQLRRTVRG
jgi:DNA-binding CsgD family transcriptional regulator